MSARPTGRRCQAEHCTREIVWARNPDTGKKVPLDRAPVYRLRETADGEWIAELIRDPDLRVSHFATCRDPGRFSGGGRS